MRQFVEEHFLELSYPSEEAKADIQSSVTKARRWQRAAFGVLCAAGAIVGHDLVNHPYLVPQDVIPLGAGAGAAVMMAVKRQAMTKQVEGVVHDFARGVNEVCWPQSDGNPTGSYSPTKYYQPMIKEGNFKAPQPYDSARSNLKRLMKENELLRFLPIVSGVTTMAGSVVDSLYVSAYPATTLPLAIAAGATGVLAASTQLAQEGWHLSVVDAATTQINNLESPTVLHMEVPTIDADRGRKQLPPVQD